MLNKALVSRELRKIASILDCYSISNPFSIIASFKQDCLEELKKKRSDLDAEEVSKEILKLNNPKKQKMALFWICKKSLILPEDQYKLDQAYEILEKTHKDFQRFEGPMDVIDSQDSAIKRQVLKVSFSPDSCRFFFDKYDAGNGVKIYTVKDSREGQLSVRRAIDSSWGLDANPWCLAARGSEIDDEDADDKFSEEEFLGLSEDEKDKLDLKLLEGALEMWYHYSAYPKRIAFKNGKLLAFCANSVPEVAWWNKQDKSSKEIPCDGAKDDSDFIEKFIYSKKRKIKMAKDPNTSPEELRELSGDEDKDVREAVAKNLNIPMEILKKLAVDRDAGVRLSVIKNPNITVDILRKLAKDKDVKFAVAQHPNTPVDIIRELAEDEDKFSREFVAHNPNTPVNILRKLAEDKDGDVRRNVAQHPNTPVDILSKLSEDKDYRARRNVAQHPNTPVDVLSKLSEDKDYGVIKNVAENQNTPVDVIRKLAENKIDGIRMSVAKNLNTPVDILRKFTKDKNEHIRECIAKNPNTPADVLRKLAKDEKVWVRRYLSQNPNTPVDILKKLTEDDDDDDVRTGAIRSLNSLKH